MQIIHETLPALQKLRDEGLVRFIGITGLPLKIFRTVLDRHALLLPDAARSFLCLNHD